MKNIRCVIFFLWQIFDSELENLLEYNGFNDWLHSFPLYRGKKTSEDDDDDHRIVGKFKVLLSFRMLNLYAWCLEINGSTRVLTRLVRFYRAL